MSIIVDSWFVKNKFKLTANTKRDLIEFLVCLFLNCQIKKPQATKLFLLNKEQIDQFEKDIDRSIYELYDINKINYEKLNGIEIVEEFLKK